MNKPLPRSVFTPISNETKTLLKQRWQELPSDLKTPRQVVGQHWVQCGFITGPSYCSFGCTHCYLPKTANNQTHPDINEIKEQLDANRRLLGPGGHIQITGGDVVDAYLRLNRFDDLIEIVRYTNEIGLVPMLMTHGQTLLEKPQRLNRLVLEGGLRKISFHIDMTQAGRAGYPIKQLQRENDLNPLRDMFAELVLSTRKQTGKRLVGAQTITVTEKNIESIADILVWQMSTRKNLSAFSTISFQPEADVGRTRYSDQPVTPENVWEKVREATGKNLVRDALQFGHPDCSSISMLIVDTNNNRIIDIMQPSESMSRFWECLLKNFGGIGGRGKNSVMALINKIVVFLKTPSIVIHFFNYAGSILKQESNRLSLLKSAIYGDVGAFKIVMHNFIDAKELENPDKITQAKLDACSFRGAIKVKGDWQAVPMCLTNSKYR